LSVRTVPSTWLGVLAATRKPHGLRFANPSYKIAACFFGVVEGDRATLMLKPFPFECWVSCFNPAHEAIDRTFRLSAVIRIGVFANAAKCSTYLCMIALSAISLNIRDPK
jgi:hypothetical protein